MPSHQRPAHDPLSAFRFRDFRLYIATNFLLILGSQMVLTALGWELYGRTGRALDLGLMGFSAVLPFLFLGLFGGNVADRFDRRRIMVVVTLVFLVNLTGLTFASAKIADPAIFRWAVFGFLFFTGCCNAFYAPAKQAFFRQLVPKKDLTNAVTWGSGAFQLAATLGPALAGILLVHLPCSFVYGTSLAFEGLFLFALLSLRPRPVTGPPAPLTLASLAEGARFVHRTKPILATITMDLFAVLLGGCTALLPIFVKDILHSGPQTLGWLRAAPSAGAMLMVVLVARTPLKRPGRVLLWAVGGFGAATVVFGLSKFVGLSLAMMFLIGALDEVSVIVRGTLVQVLTPDRLLGRVQAVNYLFINSSNELGAFESGLAAALLGPVPAVVLGGLGSIGIVLLIGRLWPQVARLGPLHQARTRT